MSWPRDLRGSSNLGHNMAQARKAPIWDRLVRARKRKKELSLIFTLLFSFLKELNDFLSILERRIEVVTVNSFISPLIPGIKRIGAPYRGRRDQ